MPADWGSAPDPGSDAQEILEMAGREQQPFLVTAKTQALPPTRTAEFVS